MQCVMSRMRGRCRAMVPLSRRWSTSAARVVSGNAYVCGNSALFAGLLAR